MRKTHLVELFEDSLGLLGGDRAELRHFAPNDLHLVFFQLLQKLGARFLAEYHQENGCLPHSWIHFRPSKVHAHEFAPSFIQVRSNWAETLGSALTELFRCFASISAFFVSGGGTFSASKASASRRSCVAARETSCPSNVVCASMALARSGAVAPAAALRLRLKTISAIGVNRTSAAAKPRPMS